MEWSGPSVVRKKMCAAQESWESKVLGGSSQLGYVVNNHGDRKSPK